MTKNEPFDPYRKWLGIPPSEQPPSHYRLLAIGDFEDDPDVISHAADRCMAHVRTFQTGARAELSQRVLNHVAEARLCLLEPHKKAAYDAHLRQMRAQSVPVSPPIRPPAPVGGLPTALPVARAAGGVWQSELPRDESGQFARAAAFEPRSDTSSAARIRRRGRKTSSPFLVLSGAAVLMMLVAMLVLLLVRSKSERVAPPAANETRAAPKPVPSKPIPPKPHSVQAERPRKVRVRPAASVGEAVEEAHRSMTDFRPERARAYLEQAASMSPSTTERSRIERLRRLVDYLDEVARAIVKGAEQFDTGTPMSTLDGRGVTFHRFEPSDEQPFHFESNRRIIKLPIYELRAAWGEQFARRAFGKDNPKASMYLGTYVALRPDGDRQYARRLWAEAMQAGVGSDELLDELGLRFGAGIRNNEASAKP